MKTVELYCFSPTGGTRKVGEHFAKALAEEVKVVDLLDRTVDVLSADSEYIVAAVPVFAGRIPTLAAKKLKTLKGQGKKAVALAVYGVRAYEDALVELTDLLEDCGFTVIGAGAFIAQHSMLAQVGAGRPDEKDFAEIEAFARKLAEKVAEGQLTSVKVPGNRPYKDGMVVAHTPISNEGCVGCGACQRACPTEAISIVEGQVETALEKCLDCLACIPVCPLKVRTLKPAHQAGIQERLGGLVDVYPANEIFL